MISIHKVLRASFRVMKNILSKKPEEEMGDIGDLKNHIKKLNHYIGVLEAQEKDMSEAIFTEGVCGDGAAILENGKQISPDRIIELLNTVPSVIHTRDNVLMGDADAKTRVYPGGLPGVPGLIRHEMTVWDWYAGQALANGTWHCSEAAMRADKMMILREERKK